MMYKHGVCEQCTVCIFGMSMLFQYEEQGGIPFRELRRRLQDYGLAEHMPPDKAEIVLKKADTDRDGCLDYEEFVRLVGEW